MSLQSRLNRELKNIAREQRSQSGSRAERRIWKTLLSKRQCGERFLRHQAIEDFTVDFFCPELNLVVEIEGNTAFTAPDYNVVRFSEDEIINKLDDVNERLRNVIYGLRGNSSSDQV